MVVETVREDEAVRRLTKRLVEAYAETHSSDEVEGVVGAVRERFEGHPVRSFVPILVERIARRELAKSIPTDEDIDPVFAAPTVEPAPVRWGPVALVHAVRAWAGTPKGALRLGVAAVVLVVVAALGVALSRTGGPGKPAAAPAPGPAPLTTVRGLVGSEKASYFADPKVAEILARNGLRVEVEPAGSRQIATAADLGRFDFAFPSSAQAAERIQRGRGITQKFAPFSSPMVVATFQPIADLLTASGVVRLGPVPTFDVGKYLEFVSGDTRWDQIDDNTVYPVHKSVLVSTTDPRNSNSAAMYLAVAGYVANGATVVQGAEAEARVLPTLSRLLVGQGYTDNSSEGPLQQYLSYGMGPTPMAWIYESQFAEASVRGRLKPGMVALYPTPTVLSQHTLVPLRRAGERLGELLTTDPQLQLLAAEHGFRTADPAQFARVAADRRLPVAPELVDVVDAPSYDTLEHLLDGVARAYN